MLFRSSDDETLSDAAGEETAETDSTPMEAVNKGTVAYTGQLKNAAGEAYYLPDATDYMDYVDGKPIAVKRIAAMNRATRGNFLGLAFEYFKLTGNKLFVNSSVRTSAEQAVEYRANPKKAAPPGSSMHEFKFALDISVARNKFLADCESKGLLRKYGFWRPLAGELWHIEAIGIHKFIKKIKAGAIDESTLEKAIMGGRGYGGGGPALMKGVKSRSDAVYEQIIQGGSPVSTARSLDKNLVLKSSSDALS